MRPALKKYGLMRPDFSVNWPKRNTCRARISSMNSLWWARIHPSSCQCVSWRISRGTSMRIITLNCNGIRSAARKALFDWLPSQSADLVSLQETRVQERQLGGDGFRPEGYHRHSFYAERAGAE